MSQPKDDPLWKEAVASAKLSDNSAWQVIEAYAEAKEEIARLTAENERLRKAGDAMADDLRDCQADEEHPLLAAWLAAKKGRDAK